MYCITIYDDHLDLINSLGYLPVGLGEDIKSSGFLRDNTDDNIDDNNTDKDEEDDDEEEFKNIDLNKLRKELLEHK